MPFLSKRSYSKTWTVCLFALLLAWAWSITIIGVGINALIRFHNDEDTIRSAVPPPTVVAINISDVRRTGAATVAGAAYTFILTTILVILLLARPGKVTHSLPLQAFLVSLGALWMIGSQIPYTLFFATRSAQVAAFNGGVQLPPSVVSVVGNALGFTPVYKHIWYLRLFAIIPWIGILFTILAATVFAFAAFRRKRSRARLGTGIGSAGTGGLAAGGEPLGDGSIDGGESRRGLAANHERGQSASISDKEDTTAHRGIRDSGVSRPSNGEKMETV